LSIGVGCLVPSAGVNLVTITDEALYRAKHLGRNRIELAETDSGTLAPDAEADPARAFVSS
jgi:hypothetical protein